MFNIVMLAKGNSFTVRHALTSLALNTKAQFSLLVVNAVGSTAKPLIVEFFETQPVTGGVIEVGTSKTDPMTQGVEQSEKWFERGARLYLCDDSSMFNPGWLEMVHHSLGNTERRGIISADWELRDQGSLYMRWDTWDLVKPFDGLWGRVKEKNVWNGSISPAVVTRIEESKDKKRSHAIGHAD